MKNTISFGRYPADILITNIDTKLKLLEVEKEKTRKAIADTSRNHPGFTGGHDAKYRLRGVATKPNVTYVLLPKEDDTDDLNMIDVNAEDDEDDTPEGAQWWRIEYVVHGTGAHIEKNKSPQYDVLRCIKQQDRRGETHEPVYSILSTTRVTEGVREDCRTSCG